MHLINKFEMSDAKQEEKKDNVYDLNIEQKPIEALKDNIKKENISDIKVKNQSLQNNTNSYSKSFESIKNDNKEKEKEIIKINNNKDSKIKRKKEEIKNLICGNNNKYPNKKRKDGIIQKANKMPELEPDSKYNCINALKKIKNKSITKKAKDLLSGGKIDIHKQKEKNKFINKLKQIEVKIEKINDYKNKNKTKKVDEENKLDFLSEDIFSENKVNDRDNFINFNFHITKSKGSSENKYQELKKLYFANNKFDFISLKKKNTKDDINKLKNYSITNNNINEEYKGSYMNYKNHKLHRKNQNMIRIVNNSDFKSILDRISKFEEFKNDTKLNKNCFSNDNILFSDFKNEKNKRLLNKNSFSFYKSVSIEKPSKLKNMLEDVYDEIQDINNYTMKKHFNNKISNMKANIHYSTLNLKNKNLDLNKNYLFNDNRHNHSNSFKFHDLLRFCNKRNLKSFVRSFS